MKTLVAVWIGVSACSNVTVVVSPHSVSVAAQATQAFTCTVSGSDNHGCGWRVVEAGGGSINMSGLYTAPLDPGTYHVVGTSVANSAASDSATVTVLSVALAACNALPAAGTWENITPPATDFSRWCVPDFNPAKCGNPGVYGPTGPIPTYGSNAFVIDPISGAVVLGTAQLGMWKSMDCGATWAKANTGSLAGPGVQAGADATLLDQGRQWTMVIDPMDSQTIYTVAGYGQGGIFKSTNGGVDWTQILPTAILAVTGAGFMEKITMDPTDHTHLLASFHTPCTGTPLPGAPVDSMGNWGCMAESTSSGVDWSLTTGIPWAGLDGPGQSMTGPKIWFYATNSGDGIWRTTTGGVQVGSDPPWTKVYDGNVDGSVYTASNGVYYSGHVQSTDGITWVDAGTPNIGSYNGSTPLVDDGTTLYVGSSTLPAAGGTSYFWTAPLGGSPPLTFTLMAAPTPPMDYGAAYVDLDRARHVLYSSNMWGGFWRTVIP